jgi:glycine cleavage system H protein
VAALLALLTFALFIGLDYALTRRKAARDVSLKLPLPARAPALDLQPLAEPVFVAGYELPETYHYPRGHTWVRVLGPDTAAVGIDDFSRRLIGRAQGLQLPRVGEWLRQGAAAFGVKAAGRTARLLAPIEGQVVEVNDELARRPTLATDDPYGHGWLFKVQSANLGANLRNLLSGRLARRWVEDAREQLELRLVALSGSVLQDGGEPARDFAEHLESDDWKHLAETFLLTEPELEA